MQDRKQPGREAMERLVLAIAELVWVCGMEVGSARRYRQIKDENRKLKQLIAEPAFDKQALKVMPGRKY